MLVISRKQGEIFYIGDDMEISILEVKGDKVKIGINAPRSMKIVRKELIDTESQNKMAAVTGENYDIEKIMLRFRELNKNL